MRCAARSARARRLRASHVAGSSPPANRAFGTRAADAARNAADVRDLLRTRLSLTDAEVDRMVRRRPLGALATVAPKLGWLQSRLDLDDAGLRKMVLLLPAVLGYSVEDNLAPMLDWLQKRLDLDDTGLRKMVLLLPAVLGFSVENNVTPKLEWLQRRLNLDEAQLKKVVLRFPSLLACSVEDNLDPKLDWLQTRLGLDDEQLRKMIVALPALMGYSIEDNLEPKLDFFERELLGGSRAELRNFLVNNPATVSRSLERCYRTRLEACRAAGVDKKRVLGYSNSSEKKFCKYTGIAPEDLKAIRESRTRVLNDFSAARVVPCATGGKKLVASGAFPAGAVLFRFAGELSPVNIGDRSLQVGRAAHLLSVPPEEPWVYLNHSFEPTVSLIVDPITPVATARTTEDLVDGAALTIDYTLHEWEMSGDGFVCSESGRRVRGFKYLSTSEREEALPRAAPHIRVMAGE